MEYGPAKWRVSIFDILIRSEDNAIEGMYGVEQAAIRMSRGLPCPEETWQQWQLG